MPSKNVLALKFASGLSDAGSKLGVNVIVDGSPRFVQSSSTCGCAPAAAGKPVSGSTALAAPLKLSGPNKLLGFASNCVSVS